MATPLHARSPRAGRRGGTVAEGPMMASRWQGVAGKLEGSTGLQERRRGSPRAAVDCEVGVAARCDGARWGPRQREGRW
jgi:hypothetical protein